MTTTNDQPGERHSPLFYDLMAWIDSHFEDDDDWVEDDGDPMTPDPNIDKIIAFAEALEAKRGNTPAAE